LLPLQPHTQTDRTAAGNEQSFVGASQLLPLYIANMVSNLDTSPVIGLQHAANFFSSLPAIGRS